MHEYLLLKIKHASLKAPPDMDKPMATMSTMTSAVITWAVRYFRIWLYVFVLDKFVNGPRPTRLNPVLCVVIWWRILIVAPISTPRTVESSRNKRGWTGFGQSECRAVRSDRAPSRCCPIAARFVGGARVAGENRSPRQTELKLWSL